MAGLLSAAMSSIDSGINSLSAVVTVDFHQRFRSGRDRRPALWVAKLVTLLAGLLAILMAFGMQLIQGNLYEVMNKSTGGLPGTLGMIVLAGVLLPRCGPRSVLAGAAVSMVCGWLITFSSEIFGEGLGRFVYVDYPRGLCFRLGRSRRPFLDLSDPGRNACRFGRPA